jgi:hypothetical protein
VLISELIVDISIVALMWFKMSDQHIESTCQLLVGIIYAFILREFGVLAWIKNVLPNRENAATKVSGK